MGPDAGVGGHQVNLKGIDTMSRAELLEVIRHMDGIIRELRVQVKQEETRHTWSPRCSSGECGICRGREL